MRILAFLCMVTAIVSAQQEGVVPLEASGGWQAQLAYDNAGTGVWTVKSYPVFDSVGSDEIVALDDRGRLAVLVPYSGRWTALRCLEEGAWLGGLARGDLDPRIEGSEIYTGGQRGNLWQVIPHAHGALETKLITHLEGREIHTIVVGDLIPGKPGNEMVFFTWPGGVYLVNGDLEVTKLGDIKARVRDAVPLASGGIAVVTRGGEFAFLGISKRSFSWETRFRRKTGFGRLAVHPDLPDVFYAVGDDGSVYRHADGKPELIYAGPPGMRGVVAGRFDEDRKKETIAVFGYSGKVELLARGSEGWTATTIFRDTDKGHWICSAEVDGRNSTPELFSCGYSGRVVMLYRPPGYGLGKTLALADPPQEAPTWKSETVFEAAAGLGGCAVGDVDPRYPGNEIVTTCGDGNIYVARRDGEGWKVESVAKTPGEMIQCAIGDVTPGTPGAEILAVGMESGGEDSGGAGALWVIGFDGEKWVSTLAARDDALIHGVCSRYDHAAKRTDIITVGYSLRALRTYSDADNRWAVAANPLAILPGAGKNVIPFGNHAVAACKDGTLLAIEAGKTRPLFKAAAGLARLGTDGQRVLIARDDGKLTLYADGAANDIYAEQGKLRGAVLADVDPFAEGIEAATAGYSGKVTVLYRASGTSGTPGAPGGWRPETVFTDTDKLHHLAAGELLAESAGQELVTCGYSRRLTVIWKTQEVTR